MRVHVRVCLQGALLALLAFVCSQQMEALLGCPMNRQTAEFCLMPEVADAGSTDSVRVFPSHIVQTYGELCKNFSTQKYRTADGSCNHLFNYGTSRRPVRRLLPNAYADGKDEPRTRGKGGKYLPSPTRVSRKIHTDRPVNSEFTFLLMQWGQFLDHDIAGFPITSEENSNMKCCGPNGTILPYSSERDCFPILLETSDTRFRGRCMEFARSVAAMDETKNKLMPREQLNSVTSFIDASNVYGSTQELQERLRDTSSAGELRASLKMSGQGRLLPNSSQQNCDLSSRASGIYCFLAGDSRVNEHLGLMTIHTIFARTHNLIVRNLRSVPKTGNKTGVDEEDLFQTARKILGAIMQNIHYGEWLPAILSPATMREYGLSTGERSRYNPLLDPRITNAFSTAVFRFGHSFIPDNVVVGRRSFPFRTIFNKPDLVFSDFEGILTGFVSTGKSAVMDRFFTKEITNHLFEQQNESRSGLDLVALNIQRGRDHGLPSFNDYRKLCGLKGLESFDDLDIQNQALKNAYRKLYGSVDDIDLFSGIMSEDNMPKSLVGPTLACLLGTQFHALKYGDRFFFEHEGDLGFTDAQLKSLRKVTMAKVLCSTGDIYRVQKNAFRKGDTTYQYPCSKSDLINFSLWGDKR